MKRELEVENRQTGGSMPMEGTPLSVQLARRWNLAKVPVV